MARLVFNVDQLMPPFLPLVYNLYMYALVRGSLSAIRLIDFTVVLALSESLLTSYK